MRAVSILIFCQLITPAAICYDYPFLFERKSVPIMAYTLESILAEKYETILRRNIGTTRARDFYDLHTLFRLRRDEVRPEILRQAVLHTAKKRGSTAELKEWADILLDMKEEPTLASLWDNYIRENTYASDFSLSEVLSTVEQIDRIEVTNKGGLYGRISVDLLGKVRPETRNPALANILEILGETENRYSGIPTIQKEMMKAN